MAFRVIPLCEYHLDAVVDIHMRAFPTFFLTFLGSGFLREFYRSFCGNPKGIGLVVVNEEHKAVVGVVVGPLHPSGYFKTLLKRRWWAFGRHSLWAVVRRPAIVPRLVRALLYRGDAPPAFGGALLSSIAVDPNVQGGGAGRMLVNGFLEQARGAGVAGAFLTTDKDGNDRVNEFYLGLGWTLESSYVTPEGRSMNRYVYAFRPCEGGGDKDAPANTG